MKRIKIKKQEHSFLEKNRREIPENIAYLLDLKFFKESIMVTDEQADVLRDYFIEWQQEVGFNYSYELTNEGEILQRLIDELYS
ncbi:MAG: hypothetical protein P0S96_01165 [Simkaniaceae bacterium]|nr:hypothetical protein [Candidatus Sacchlamyda saccharinae]